MQSMLNIWRLSEDALAGITIRNLEDDRKRRLRIRGAEHGRSMEEEAREILRHVMTRPATRRNLMGSQEILCGRRCAGEGKGMNGDP